MRLIPRLASPLVACAALAATLVPSAGATTLNLQGQAQQKTNWCWAATGNSIATYFGKKVSQNTFCDLAFNQSTNRTCSNSQATLGNEQVAFRSLGISPGNYVSYAVDDETIYDQISAGSPINTRIEWSSGGGHMMTIYGYDWDSDTVNYYNPWPDDARYNTASRDWYVSNDDFSWTHSLYGIGAN